MNKIYVILTFVLLSGCVTKQSDKIKLRETTAESTFIREKVTASDKNYSSFDTLLFIKKNRRAGVYWYASSDSLMDNDLDLIPPSELRIMRNEIFARYGYIFKSEDLKAYFGMQGWYKPVFENVDKYLTSKERHNISFIHKCEGTNKEISQGDLFKYYLDKVNNHKLDEVPRMVCQKFGESAFADFQGLISVREQVFIKSSNFRYLIFSRYKGCNECPDEYFLNKYTLDGKKIQSWELGNDLQTIEMESDSVLYCFGVEYPHLSFEDDSTEIKPEDLDTIKLHIIMVDSGDLRFDQK